jgi:putative peptidoglycan lipid II flippase
LGIDPGWGVAGLTATAGIAGWVEFTLLRRTLNRRIGVTGLPASLTARLWLSAALSAAAGWAVKPAATPYGPIVTAVAAIGVYGVVYFSATWMLRVEESASLLRRIRR